jgi:cytochrome c-type biogenesis protein CcmH/NrfG
MSDKLPKQDDHTTISDNYILIGNQQSKKGDNRGALVAYERAIRLSPRYARAYNYRG